MKRLIDRIDVELNAEIISRGNIRYEGVIENLSSEGIGVSLIAGKKIAFSLGETVNIEFLNSSGQILKFDCLVTRMKSSAPESSKYILGLKIIERSPEYEEFYKSKFINNTRVL